MAKRTTLASLGSNKRYTFTASYERCGYKAFKKHYTPTLLLSDVRYNGERVTSHLWFTYTKRFRELGHLHMNDEIQFTARVSTYMKGYGPREDQTMDYQLSYPSHIKLIKPIDKIPRLPLPLDHQHIEVVVGLAMKENADFYINNIRPYSRFYARLWDTWMMQQELKHYHGLQKELLALYFLLLRQYWIDSSYTNSKQQFFAGHRCITNYMRWLKVHPKVKRLLGVRKLPKVDELSHNHKKLTRKDLLAVVKHVIRSKQIADLKQITPAPEPETNL